MPDACATSHEYICQILRTLGPLICKTIDFRSCIPGDILLLITIPKPCRVMKADLATFLAGTYALHNHSS